MPAAISLPSSIFLMVSSAFRAASPSSMPSNPLSFVSTRFLGLAMAACFGIQGGDLRNGCGGVECHLLTVVVDVHRLAVLENYLALIVELQFHGCCFLGYPASVRLPILGGAPGGIHRSGNANARMAQSQNGRE
ncbi:hypothetical protein ACU4GD_28070 [Cupriavidus basilensis]